MNTNTIIGVVAAVVIVGGGFYLLNRPAGVPATFGQEQALATTTETVVEQGKFTGSLAELSARGGSWKCSVDSTTAQAVSSGATYVSGGKVRADFTTSVPSYGAVETHLIADGVDVYTWSSMMPQGIKSKMTAQGSGTGPTSGQDVNTDTKYSYDCQPWTADATLFVVPANITFRAM
jgi:hypothetical protein